MRRLVIALAFVAWLGGRASADKIRQIVVEDNTKTTSDTVELIADIEVGDEWTPEMSDLVKERLVTSGLFRDVEVFWEPVSGGVRVHILAKDKHSWVIAPAFYQQPTNTGGGVGFGENNLFGLNQKLLIYAQIATGDSFFVGAWVIPSIGGSRFYAQLDTYDKSARNIEYAPSTAYLDTEYARTPEVRRSRINYLNAGLKLGVELFRGVKLDSRLRGAHVSYGKVSLADGATIDQVTGDPTSDPTMVPKPGMEGWDVSNEWTLTIDRRANWYGIQSGHRYHASFEYAVPKLGSDFHYYQWHLELYKAIQILERHNLVLKANLNVGHHLPFQQEFTMGGTTMRGWLNNQFRGDLRAVANIEYSLPLFTIHGLSVRGLGFVDSGFTTFLTTSNPERNYLPDSQYPGLGLDGFKNGFKNSIGIGTRLYLRQIVLPLLGLDLGYGVEARDFQVYLAIGLTD